MLSGHGLPFTQFFSINFSATTRFGFFLIPPVLKQQKIMRWVVDKGKLRVFAIFLCGVQRFWAKKCKTHLRLSFSFDFISILKTFKQKTFISYVSLTYWQKTVKNSIKKKLLVKKLFAILNAYISTRTTLTLVYFEITVKLKWKLQFHLAQIHAKSLSVTNEACKVYRNRSKDRKPYYFNL